jgi:hypothetical protein
VKKSALKVHVKHQALRVVLTTGIAPETPFASAAFAECPTRRAAHPPAQVKKFALKVHAKHQALRVVLTTVTAAETPFASAAFAECPTRRAAHPPAQVKKSALKVHAKRQVARVGLKSSGIRQTGAWMQKVSLPPTYPLTALV